MSTTLINSTDNTNNKYAKMAYSIIINKISEPCKELEAIIAKDAEYSYKYALEFIKGPWPQGEDAIVTWAGYSTMYASDVIKGRWVKGETRILLYPRCIYDYTINALKAPWPEAEHLLPEGDEHTVEYYKRFPKKLNEEECILKIKELEEKCIDAIAKLRCKYLDTLNQCDTFMELNALKKTIIANIESIQNGLVE
jgi:hypothetical protein